jgi:hypothetical protein
LEEKDMPHWYYWPDDDYDFVYAGLDPQYIKAFLAALGRSKPNGKMLVVWLQIDHVYIVGDGSSMADGLRPSCFLDLA